MRLRLLSAAHPNVRILTHLAEAYRKAGDLERARETVERGLARHAEYPGAHVVLGRVLHDQGDLEGAERAFRRVLELDPENRIAREWLARARPGHGTNGKANGRPAGAVDGAMAAARGAADAAAAARRPMDAARAAPAAAAASRPPGSAIARAPVGDGGAMQPRMAPVGDGGGARPRTAPVPEEDATQPRTTPAGGSNGARPRRSPAAGDAAGALDRRITSSQPPVPIGPGRAGALDRRTAPSRPAVVIGPGRADTLDRRAAPPASPEPASPEPASSEPASSEPPSRQPPVRAYFERLLGYRPAMSARQPGGRGRETPGAPAVDVVALTELLVGLLEYRDPLRRGTSGLTRRVAVAIGRELGMRTRELDELALAALLRDLGRFIADGRRPEHDGNDPRPAPRRSIGPRIDLALKLLDGIALPAGVRAAIRHHRERRDGAGSPDLRAGTAIPLAARVLAVADALATLTAPRPDRPPHRLAAAVATIRAEAGRRYDPAVVDALVRTLADPRRRRTPDFDLRDHVIVVDADHPRALALAARLCTQGYAADAVADPDDARRHIRRSRADVVVLAADLPCDATLAFLDALRADPTTADIAVIAVNADSAQRRIELLDRGADACFATGVALDELRAAIGALLKRAPPTVDRGHDTVDRGPDADGRRPDDVAPRHALRGELGPGA
ncbi:MAG TPA: HD domain-containing phosphohydrolase [Longimicrobiales bacterium]